MDSSLRKLTIICPRVLDSNFLDVLDSIEDLPGYTVVDALGRGPTTEQLSQREQVKGAMDAIMAIMILPQSQLDSVLSAVASSFAHTHISYWVEPVLDFARLQ